MSKIDVIMPQMGESIAEGTLSRWLKKVGDTVKRDEPIFEISTDKVDAEIPAPVGWRAGRDSGERGADGRGADGRRADRDRCERRAPRRRRRPRQAADAAPAPAPRASAAAAASARGSPPRRASRPRRLRARSLGRPRPARRRHRRQRRWRIARGAAPHQIVAARPQMAAEHGLDLSAISRHRNRRPRHQERHPRAISSRRRRRPASRRSARRAPDSARRAAAAAPAPTLGPRRSSRGRRPRRADVEDPRAHREHMVMSRQTSPHVTSFFEVDFTRIAQHPRQDQRGVRGATATSSPICRSSSRRSPRTAQASRAQRRGRAATRRSSASRSTSASPSRSTGASSSR